MHHYAKNNFEGIKYLTYDSLKRLSTPLSVVVNLTQSRCRLFNADKYIDFRSTITYGSYSVHSLRDGSDYQQKIKGRESKVGVPVKSICIVNR